MNTTIVATVGLTVLFIYLILILTKVHKKRSLKRMPSKWEYQSFELANYKSFKAQPKTDLPFIKPVYTSVKNYDPVPSKRTDNKRKECTA